MTEKTYQFNSYRSPVFSRHGMVASSQPFATAAGIEILEKGGNAADAAVATAAALNVTEPTSTGIGGDAFALYYDAKTRTMKAINGSGRAPQGLSLERLQKEGFGSELPAYHPHTVTVPGACAAWCDVIKEWGRLSLSDVLAPAIRLAEEGFPVAPLTSYFWQRGAERQLSAAPNGIELTIDGRGPRAGEIFRNVNLAKTFQAVAEGGKDAFYQGAVAEAIVEVLSASGGAMTLDDLAAHHSTWEEPISTVYRGIRIWECPPNGQGLAALLALNILEGFDLSAHDSLSPERMHLLIEAMRLAFADGRRYVADPAFYPAPLEALLSKEYAAHRRKKIDRKHANPDVHFGVPFASTDTVYFSVVDAEGNACSFIISNYMGFGTGIVPKGWGFTLQNRGHNFSLDPTHPNALAPGKRPYHTIIPAMATREADQSLYACFGVMGGFMQPQGHMQVTVAMVDDLLDPQSSLDQPRFCIEPDAAGSQVSLEEGIPIVTLSRLTEMGHQVKPVSGLSRALFGRGQIIQRNQVSGVLCGGSDPRADGCAMPQIKS
ncbi:MAG: gamma-glutamyltransferase [Anaerolineaceae bacterium]|nr:gamma-glutamyltransferase [Anaerolineaceae bacterium]